MINLLGAGEQLPFVSQVSSCSISASVEVDDAELLSEVLVGIYTIQAFDR